MTREMEYAKCMAVLRKLFRKGMVSEAEYNKARQKLMDKYLIVQSNECDAA